MPLLRCKASGLSVTSEMKETGIRRFAVLFASFAFFGFMHAGFVSFNCAYVAMAELETSPLYNEETHEYNGSETEWNADHLPLADRRFHWDETMQGWSFGAGFIGTMLGVPVLGYAAPRLGYHSVMTYMGIMMAVICFVLPVTVAFSFELFLLLRVLTGSVLSILLAASGHVISNWAPLNERGVWIAVLSSHIEFSPIFSMPHSGFVGTHISWPAIFYSHGGFIFVFTCLWMFVHKNDPREVKWLNAAELRIILDGKVEMTDKPIKHETKAPYKEIARTRAVLAVWIACVGHYLVMQFCVTFSNLYFSTVLDFSQLKSGMVSMGPLIVILILKLSTGYASDRLTVITELTRIRIFNSLSFFGSAVFFLLVALRSPDGSWLDVAQIYVAIGLLGFYSGGYPKCAVIISRQYSSTVFSIMQMLGCMPLVGASFLVSYITPNDTPEEWRLIFIFYSAVLIISNIIFCIFADDQPCKWTHIPSNSSEVQTQNKLRV